MNIFSHAFSRLQQNKQNHKPVTFSGAQAGTFAGDRSVLFGAATTTTQPPGDTGDTMHGDK